MLLRFDEFMRRALYDEAWGYYTQGPSRVGKKGDFFTSVSVGDLFGRLLCRRFYLFWEAAGGPDEFPVIEMGANDGQLACDILDEAAKSDPRFLEALRYHIMEPLSALHVVQQEKTGGRVRVVASAEELNCRDCTGIVFGNELLDAFPVRMAVVRQGRWMEKYVRVSPEFPEGDCFWEECPLPEGECPPVSADHLPEGYVTEWCDGWDSFWQSTSSLIKSGLFLFVDYGRNQADYYDRSRSEGTLRTYYQHTRTDNPLLHVGNQDITADVDFTAVAESAKQVGVRAALFADQGQWLTTLARPWLLSLEKTMLADPVQFRKEISRFQTLTHPGQMGMRFRALELMKGEFSSMDLLVPVNWKQELWGELFC